MPADRPPALLLSAEAPCPLDGGGALPTALLLHSIWALSGGRPPARATNLCRNTRRGAALLLSVEAPYPLGRIPTPSHGYPPTHATHNRYHNVRRRCAR